MSGPTDPALPDAGSTSDAGSASDATSAPARPGDQGPATVLPPDAPAEAAARARWDILTKPPGSLGRLEDLGIWAAAVQGRCPPEPFSQVRLVLVAGDHGVVRAAGTSAYPPEVTAQMVANFLAGGAAANVLAARHDVGVRVVDAAVDSDYAGLPVPEPVRAERIRRGTGPIDRADAMTLAESERSLALGTELADREADAGADLLIVGDMGIGNTTVAATLVAALTGADAVTATGRGTGIDDATWMRKVSAVRDALWRARHDTDDMTVLLARVGGADFGVMAGLLLGAARRRTPVLLDGAVVAAAALVAARLDPGAPAWWLAGHESVEPCHSLALDSLGLQPVLRLGMRLGEGSGALAALPILQSAVALLGEMATFESAGVSEPPPDPAVPPSP